MKLTDQLIAVAAAFAAASGLSEATVSTRALGSGADLKRLRAGGDMRSRKIEAGLQWFSDRWPEGAPWPIHVPRPAAPPSAPAPSSAAPAGPPI